MVAKRLSERKTSRACTDEYQFAILGDRILAFQNLDNDGTGCHEGNEVVKEGTTLVLGIKASL